MTHSRSSDSEKNKIQEEALALREVIVSAFEGMKGAVNELSEKGGDVAKLNLGDKLPLFDENQMDKKQLEQRKKTIHMLQVSSEIIRSLTSFKGVLNQLPDLNTRFPTIQDDFEKIITSSKLQQPSSKTFFENGDNALYEAAAQLKVAETYDNAIKDYYKRCEDLSFAIVRQIYAGKGAAISKKDINLLNNAITTMQDFIKHPENPNAAVAMTDAMRDINKRVNVVKRGLGFHGESTIHEGWARLSKAGKVLLGISVAILIATIPANPLALMVLVPLAAELLRPTRKDRAMMEVAKSGDALLSKTKEYLMELTYARPNMTNNK